MDLQEKITCIHLPDDQTIHALNEYKTLLISLINKRIVVISNVGGLTNFVSERTLEEIELQNEISSIVNTMVMKLPYYNIYSGILFSSLLTKFWSEPIYKYGVHKLTNYLLEFKVILDEALSSLKYEHNLLDLISLQSALKHLMLQEPMLPLSEESLNKLSYEIVKGVLTEVNIEDGFKVGRFNVHVQAGSDYFQMINGIICEIDDATSSVVEIVKPTLGTWNKMLLFTENICGSDSFSVIIKIILDNNIKLIMCQKKMSKLQKVTFRRNNVVVVERIGLEATKNIEQATGCVPISNIDRDVVNDIPAKIGYYSSFHHEILNRFHYIVIQRKGNNVSTLYVSFRSFSSLSDIRKLCSQSIKYICAVIINPYFLPGSISFEEKLICHLKNILVNSEITALIISIFCDILNEIKNLYKNTNIKHNSSSDSTIQTGDIYHLKRNALLYCIDGVINFLSIGMIVRK